MKFYSKNEVLQKRVFKQQLSKLALKSPFLIAEYGAAWLARTLGVGEVVGLNPATPTMTF